MKKIAGIFLMGTIAYAGFIGINSYFVDPITTDHQKTLSTLQSKLQKTLVMIDDTEYSKKTEPVKAKKLNIKKIENVKPVASSNFQTNKVAMLKTMTNTFNSLLSVKHIFRHEITEMISIIINTQQVAKLSNKEVYAKNWARYIKNNVSKFNMNQASKNKVSNMVNEMGAYISLMTNSNRNVTPVKKVQRNKIARVVNTAPVTTKLVAKKAMIATTTTERLTKKSIAESLQAFKKLEQSQKSMMNSFGSLGYIWLALVGVFALISLWMSSTENVTVVEAETEVEDEDVASAFQLEGPTVDVIMANNEEQIKEDFYFFDEITNNLSNICQAKGIRLETGDLDKSFETVEKYSLQGIEGEIEGFLKTIIRSLGREGGNTVNVYLKEGLTRLKLVASVSSGEAIDLNMARVADGFRSLEEKLSTRKGVFNIEQNIGGKNIDFIMQVALNDNKNVEQESAISL